MNKGIDENRMLKFPITCQYTSFADFEEVNQLVVGDVCTRELLEL